MNILPLLLLCSLALVAGAVVMFVVSARQGDCNQAERLCLLPLEDDDPISAERQGPTPDRSGDPDPRPPI